jgi:hypothetical protein
VFIPDFHPGNHEYFIGWRSNRKYSAFMADIDQKDLPPPIKIPSELQALAGKLQ